MTPLEFMLLAVVFYFVMVFGIAGWLRKTKLIHIADFQAGLRYKDGVDCTLLPPGSYRERADKAPITVVDQRPNQFLHERILYKDALQTSSLISFAGAIRICDPALAVNSTKEPINAAMGRIREELQLAASHSIACSSPDDRAALSKTIQNEVNQRFRSLGIEVCGLEIIEAWSWPTMFSPTVGAN